MSKPACPTRRLTRDPWSNAATVIGYALALLVWSAVILGGQVVNRHLADAAEPPLAAVLSPAAASPAANAAAVAVSPEGPASAGPSSLAVGSHPASSAVLPSPERPYREGEGPGVRTSSAAEYSPACALFRLTARKALAGQFGTLKPWQRAAYQRGLRSCHSARVMLTTYGPWDPGRYKGSVASAAANELSQGTVIWIPSPAHLRAISTTGSHRNDRRARARGCQFWIDLWTPYVGWRGLGNDTWSRHIVIVR